jgi:hypothetical protein
MHNVSDFNENVINMLSDAKLFLLKTSLRVNSYEKRV